MQYGLPEHRNEGASRNDADAGPPQPKEEANFGTSGLLTEEANTFNGVVVLYNQPPEARKPKARWRFYPFKGEEALDPIYLHRQSAYLIGRDKRVCDMPLLHPSISKQHAVLQYRLVSETVEGRRLNFIKPYLIDLGSANKTFLNGEPIEAQRYYELREKDVIKFGNSTREYVLLTEQAADN